MPEYRVALRHTTLASAETLQSAGEDRYFIPSAAPPPAHSILTLHDGDEVKYFLVDRAIESNTPEQASGIIGRLTDAEAHEQASQLGSEHLEDGEAFVADGGAPQMAVPSPVVDPDPSEDIDPEERARLEDSEAEADAMMGGPPPSESEQTAAADAATGESGDSAEDGEEKTSGRRRKRRGRKKR